MNYLAIEKKMNSPGLPIFTKDNLLKTKKAIINSISSTAESVTKDIFNRIIPEAES